MKAISELSSVKVINEGREFAFVMLVIPPIPESCNPGVEIWKEFTTSTK